MVYTTIPSVVFRHPTSLWQGRQTVVCSVRRYVDRLSAVERLRLSTPITACIALAAAGGRRVRLVMMGVAEMLAPKGGLLRSVLPLLQCFESPPPDAAAATGRPSLPLPDGPAVWHSPHVDLLILPRGGGARGTPFHAVAARMELLCVVYAWLAVATDAEALDARTAGDGNRGLWIDALPAEEAAGVARGGAPTVVDLHGQEHVARGGAAAAAVLEAYPGGDERLVVSDAARAFVLVHRGGGIHVPPFPSPLGDLGGPPSEVSRTYPFFSRPIPRGRRPGLRSQLRLPWQGSLRT